MRLTDITIRSLKAPPTGAVIFYDEVVAGFGIRVSEGGTKSFILTHGPRRERETLGRVGVVSLHDARAEAKRRLAEYTLGKERPRTKPWDIAVAEYLAEVAAKRKPRTHQSYKYALDRHFKYGSTKLSELRPHDLHKNLDRLMDRPAEQQHAYVALRALTHWTGAPHRIDRTFGKRFGDRDYAFEELVAELGAAFMCSAFRIVNEPRQDHAAYISNWLEILDRDHKAIFTAASMAQQAVEYLRALAGP